MIWLYNSRVLATIAVIIVHTAANVVVNSNIESGNWWIGNIFNSFFRWCVPVFIMISGALLLDSNKSKEDFIFFYKKRLSRILIPILFWSIFFIIWSVIKEIVICSKFEIPSMSEVFNKLIKGEPYYHMWFLYMISALYLFTPFFRKIAECSNGRELKVLVVLTISISIIYAIYKNIFFIGSEIFFFRFLSYIPYFFLGHLIMNYDQNASKFVLWCIFISAFFITAIGCFVFAIKEDLHAGLYFYDNLSISVIPMSVSIMYLLKKWNNPIYTKKVTVSLSSLTLGVYLIHPIFLEAIQYVGLNPLKYNPAVSIPSIAIIVFCISLLTSWVIYKIPYLRRVI